MSPGPRRLFALAPGLLAGSLLIACGGSADREQPAPAPTARATPEAPTATPSPTRPQATPSQPQATPTPAPTEAASTATPAPTPAATLVPAFPGLPPP